ncbi:glycoside hydrolase family 71 protein [Desarmillaria tabescens]|uniref:Glycoside hydrolase family 71 protein n=1 Tax=Armillaria tabescens TaxID=1929756 RepID=A0AA39N9Y9_ARMTA|nr:glycoside hydrolase family 71 protein [Desarmillaria tabescens]KAK0461733.1 glycoside hydrolase family 71 protein [Desarmillaria tabescens]
MRVTHLLFIPLFFALSVLPVLGRFSQRSHGSLSSAHKAKRVAAPAGNDTLEKRDSTKYIFMHHASCYSLIRMLEAPAPIFITNLFCIRYPYTQSDWADDIARIGTNSVDAIALNIGDDDWQLSRITDAYAAAVGTNMKLFISFDYTAFACDVSKTISYINQFKSHPNQFYYNGQVMVSSYSGDCLGTGGWQTIKSSTSAYLMPFIWGLEGSFGSTWSFLDSWLCWGCAWPQGDYDKNTSDDQYYISQLGTRYATTISMWIFTHYSWADKNFYLRGDDWLIANRWEQLISMRDQLTFVEMVTWNDYGESDYFGPFKGAQPDGTYWAENFPHTIFYDLSQYYITAFKTGSYPAITQDVIYYWARPHPYAANANADSLGKPTGWDWGTDSLWALVFATSSASVTLQIGGSSQTFSVGAGVTKLSIPLDYGQITVTMVKNSQTVIDQTATDFTYIASPSQYNYNAYAGAAAASAVATSTSSTSTTASTTAAAATSTNIVFQWTSQGCYTDSADRLLRGSLTTINGLTTDACISSCSSAGFTMAATEYMYQCLCGNTLYTTGGAGSSTSSNDCNMPCQGDSTETCGGSYRANLYTAPGTTLSRREAAPTFRTLWGLLI